MTMTKKNNPDLIAARAKVESAQFSLRAAIGNFLPQISGNASRSKSGGTQMTLQDETTLSFTAQQSLFTGFKTKANLDSARARLEQAEASFALEEARIIFELRSAFINLLYAQENIKLLKEIRERREANKKLIELRYEGGRENRGAVLRAKAQLSQAQFELEQAERSKGLMQTRLTRLLGKDSEKNIEVKGNFDIPIEITQPNFSLLTTQTPHYKIAQANVSLSNAGLLQSRSNFYPSISLSASGRRRGNDVALDNDSWSVGTTLSFPFFSGGSDFYGTKQANAELKQASADLESQKREIYLSLEEAFVKLQDATVAVEIQKQFLEAAETRAQIARAQYNNGLLSYQDWDIIENDLINAEKQNLESKRRASIAEAEWKNVQGIGFGSDK